MRKGIALQAMFEAITRKWWFLLLILLLFLIPAYSSVKFDPQKTPKVVIEVLSNALIYSYPVLIPFFKIIPILFVIAIVILKNRAIRAFSIYIAALSVAFAVLQTMAFTESYGFAILTGNLVPYLIVSFFWILEAIVKENKITDEKKPLWRFWVIPFALFSFWYPIDLETLKPDFSPLYILTSES